MKPVSDRVLDGDRGKKVKNGSREQDELFQESDNNLGELFQESDNNLPANEDTENESLILLLYNNIKHIESIEDKNRRELFYNLDNNLRKQWFKTFIGYLIEHKAIMWETFSKANPWFNQQAFYRGLKIIKPFIKKLKISNSKLISQGNQPKIYMWIWASAEDFHNEQGLYAQILLEDREAGIEYIRQEKQIALERIEAEAASKQSLIKNKAQAVILYIGEWDGRLQTIDKAISDVGVSDHFRDVKNRVIDHYVNLKKQEQLAQRKVIKETGG